MRMRRLSCKSRPSRYASSTYLPSHIQDQTLTDIHLQYFKSIEKVALEQGFEQILPSKVRTGNGGVIPRTKVDEISSPTILAPQPTTSRLLRATPATEYPVRSVSPDLVPDRMASRIPEPSLNKRLTPNPEQQAMRQNNMVNAY